LINTFDSIEALAEGPVRLRSDKGIELSRADILKEHWNDYKALVDVRSQRFNEPLSSCTRPLPSSPPLLEEDRKYADEHYCQDELVCLQAEAAVQAWLNSAHRDAVMLAVKAYNGIQDFEHCYSKARTMTEREAPILPEELNDKLSEHIGLIISLGNKCIDNLVHQISLPLLATALVGGPQKAIWEIGSNLSPYGRHRFYDEIEYRQNGPRCDVLNAREKLSAICEGLYESL
jgi:hypothetical protein